MNDRSRNFQDRMVIIQGDFCIAQTLVWGNAHHANPTHVPQQHHFLATQQPTQQFETRTTIRTRTKQSEQQTTIIGTQTTIHNNNKPKRKTGNHQKRDNNNTRKIILCKRPFMQGIVEEEIVFAQLKKSFIFIVLIIGGIIGINILVSIPSQLDRIPWA